VQRFVPEIAQGDKRVLVIAGKPVPFSLARIRRQRVRQLAAGGKGVAQKLSARDFEIASALGRCSRRAGCCCGAGRDRDYLTEIN